MKILITITGPWGTGAATVVDGVARELLELGHEVKVVFPDLGLPSPDKGKYYGRPELYEIMRFPAEHRGTHFPTFPLILPDPNPRNIPDAWTFKDMSPGEFTGYIDFLRHRLGKIVESFQPDIIESEHVWLMGYVLHEMGAYVAAAHNSDQMGYRYDSRMRPYAEACARNAQYVFAISEAVKNQCLDLYGVPGERVVVIPNGYDTRLFRPRRISKEKVFRKHGLEADASLPVVTFGGKISKTKGVDVLLKANALLQDKKPYLLLLFGAGEIRDVLGRDPSDHETRNVRFMGHVTPDVLAEFHNVSEFSVLPSREEGFSVAALEAMGCGLPLVGTDIPSLGKLVVGQTVPVGHPSKLAEAMEFVLTLPPDKKGELGEKARRKALGYSWKKNAETRLRYYRAAVSS
jgi:glycosyltransferase involved in cell wall biosynthesis